MPTVDCEFYVDLRGLLAAKGLSIRDIADMTGLEYNRLYRMINEEREYISRKALGRVLLTLGIKPQPPFYIRTVITEGENRDDEATRGSPHRRTDGDGPT